MCLGVKSFVTLCSCLSPVLVGQIPAFLLFSFNVFPGLSALVNWQEDLFVLCNINTAWHQLHTNIYASMYIQRREYDVDYNTSVQSNKLYDDIQSFNYIQAIKTNSIICFIYRSPININIMV